MSKDIEKFFELLDKIVNANGSVNEKKASVLAESASGDRSNLNEFISWFDDDDFG